MTHWRTGKLFPNADGGESDQEVKVVDKLPKEPPSQVVFLTYDAQTQSGGNYWRWSGEGWEPDTAGITVPSSRLE